MEFFYGRRLTYFIPMKYQYSYLVRVQFLGFRLHGWQKQPNLKTVHFILDKTLKFVLDAVRFKSVGVGRTDAKVSSSNYPFQLFTDKKIDIDSFLESFNKNSPADICVLSIRKINDNTFNIIQHPKIKEYHYYFSNEGKNHPYAAPLLVGYQDLDISLMKKGAKLFEGTHFFGKYCTKPTENTILLRTIESSEIVKNTVLTASFFPKTSYVFKIKSKGFLRYQIRLMMGVLIELGKNNITLNEIKESLIESKDIAPLATIAPGSGLHLYKVTFLD